MKQPVILTFTFALIFSSVNLGANATCNSVSSDVQAQVGSDTEFGPLQIAIQDLTDSINLINEGNKKTAITILKSAKSQLRKIKELTPRMVKGMGARLDKAIKAVKSGKNSTALDEINHVLSELQAL